MDRIIQCVPNFSEGRNAATVQALAASVTSVSGVRLLDQTMDPDHHRSVLTFAGPPEAVEEAAFCVVRLATERIDLRRHTGVHPRVGATDVVPFVPIHGVPMEECVQLARRFGERVGTELGIPVFLYEQAAIRAGRARLEVIRRGGLEGLAGRMRSDPTWSPDFGPSRLHETAGALAVGARRPLIAFNVNLKSKDIKVAKAIANTIRESNGGLPCVKAIGVELASRGLVQVSMNLTDYRMTSVDVVFRAVKAESGKHGVDIAGSEIIGLVPRGALDSETAQLIRLERFDPMQVLETKLAAMPS